MKIFSGFILIISAAMACFVATNLIYMRLWTDEGIILLFCVGSGCLSGVTPFIKDKGGNENDIAGISILCISLQVLMFFFYYVLRFGNLPELYTSTSAYTLKVWWMYWIGFWYFILVFSHSVCLHLSVMSRMQADAGRQYQLQPNAQ